MQTQRETPCIRCGRERVFKRKWQEVVGKGSVITHVETVCPDSSCQAIVDAELATRREKRLLLENKGKAIKLS